VEFRVLGPLTVLVDGEPVRLGRSREQRVLAALLTAGDQVVPVERLVDLLWDDGPPDTAAKLVRNCVSTLRGSFADSRIPGNPISTEAAGYALHLAEGQLDVQVFGQQVARARRAARSGHRQQAVALFRSALALWRGPALAGIAGRGLEAVAAGLDEQRLAVLKECLAHERALGLEPGPELQRLEHAILRDDEQILLPETAPRPQRTVPGQLPADVTPFTDRGDQLSELDGLLGPRAADHANAVVISAIAGTAGVGKTALAVHWAHRIRNRFGDGQLYVNLRGYAPNPPLRALDALASFLRALGVPADQVPVEAAEAAGLYRSLLADQRVLVVLDNASSPEQVRPLLPGSPGCLVIVTSRHSLAGLTALDGARRLTLDVLAPAEASGLLSQLLGASRVDAEPEATVELARLCAHLPLALRVAAANLADGRRGIAEYVAELRAGSRVAALAVAGDEHAAVRSAFDLSYGSLPPATQYLFRCLGLTPGADIATEAAGALAGLPTPDAERGLHALAAAHLVDEHAAGRFTFHDLLRAYAADRAHADDSEAARLAAEQRLIDHYVGRVNGAARVLYPEILRVPAAPTAAVSTFDSHAAALAWLEAERANLVAMVDATATAGPRSAAWLLADGLRGYFHLRMHTVDWLAVAGQALAAAAADSRESPAMDAREGHAAAELSLGDAYWRMSRYPESIAHYTRAAELAAETGWLRGLAAILGNLGNVLQQSGRLAEAADHYAEALAIATETGWVNGQAANLENLGAVYWELGRLDEAADQLQRGLAIFSEIESVFGQGVLRTSLGEVRHALGQADQALDQLTRALALHREVGNVGGEAETLRDLAVVHRDNGDLDRAGDLAEQALTLARDAGDRRYESDALNTVATIRLLRGDHRAAAALHEQAMELAREIGNRYPEAEALIGLAVTHRLSGQPERARGYADQALVLARRVGYRVLEAQALAALGEPRENT
jgi:tetratricopeptide (TPR) repeat protein